MKHDRDMHRRRSIRLRGYNYSQEGPYFVTICIQNRECLFGEVADGEMRLNDAGKMVSDAWQRMLARFPHAGIDEFIVMPNHFHGILILSRRGEPCVRPDVCVRPDFFIGNHTSGECIQGDRVNTGECIQGEHKVRPYKEHPRGTMSDSVGRMVQAFKSVTTGEYVCGVRKFNWRPFRYRLWQRNYYEHIIRDEDELNRIRQYVRENPLQWESDNENPTNYS
jgi:putative transposase